MGAPRFEGVGGVSMAHLVRGNRQIDADTFFRATAHLVFSEKWRGIKYLHLAMAASVLTGSRGIPQNRPGRVLPPATGLLVVRLVVMQMAPRAPTP